jgi:hypothetical protein
MMTKYLRKQLKAGFILSYCIRDFSLWSLGLDYFRPVVRQRAWWRKAAHLIAARRQGE